MRGGGGQLKFILAYPELTGRDGDLLASGSIATVAAAAEAAGFGGLAFTEHPAPGARWMDHGGHQTLDPFVALACAASATRTLKLLTYLSVMPYRNPLLLAKAAASLDLVSGGRLILGVGAGYNRTEFAALGVDFEVRNRLFDEALDVLPRAWSGQPFSYEGLRFDAREVVQVPAPPQQPIPIWIGGNSRLTRRRVAERAQGWMPMGAPAEVARTVRTPALDSLAALAGMIEEVKAAAGTRAETLEFAYSCRDLELGAGGIADAGRHREAMLRLEQCGVTWTVVVTEAAPPEKITDFIGAFASDVMRP